MRLFLPRSLAPFFFVTLAAAMPFAAGSGCGRTACFAFSAEAYAKNGMTCPAQMDALPNFTDPSCPGPVTAVDGDGTFDGELCCYPVTEEDIQPNCGQGAGGGQTSPPGVGGFNSEVSTGFTGSSGSFGGFGGVGGEGFGGSGVGGASVGGAGIGGAGGGGGVACASSCKKALDSGLAPCSNGSAEYANLQTCAGCGGGGPCLDVCPDLCTELSASMTCLTCLNEQCPTQLADCSNN